jgi:hypothetical protein
MKAGGKGSGISFNFKKCLSSQNGQMLAICGV